MKYVCGIYTHMYLYVENGIKVDHKKKQRRTNDNGATIPPTFNAKRVCHVPGWASFHSVDFAASLCSDFMAIV